MITALLIRYLAFLLILFRVVGIVGFAPLFGSATVPRRVKIGLSILIAMMLFPVVPVEAAALPRSLSDMVLVAGKELAIGVTIGFVANLVFIGVQLAGTLVGRQVGFAIANILDPMTESEQSVIAQFYFLFALAIFVLIDGPGMLLRSMAVSFQKVPLGNFTIDGDTFEFLALATQSIFVTGLRIAAPTVIALFMVLIGLGFVARTVPQLNILVVGFSLNIMVGLFVMIISMTAVALVIRQLLWEVVAFEVPDLITLFGS